MRLTLNKVDDVFNKLNIHPHYLSNKHISNWDVYDKANWNSIIRNTQFNNLRLNKR